MKYFIYCRKSSEAEDRQILSIESQLSTLKQTFEGHLDIEIVDVYEEAFSAKAPGRPLFNKMVARIEAGDAQGVIAWAPDRLARNSIDGGRIIYLLDRGVVHDLKFATYTFENNPQGKFMLQIMFGQSKYYSDALSENVKRGNRTKLENGWRPNHAPLGYLNEKATRTIIKDPERAPIIRRMFDHMLTGAFSPRRICELAAYEWGLRTIKRKRTGGKAIALSATYRILTNPFYAGILVWKGKVYRGSHEPIISLDELERVRTLLRRRDKSRPHTRCFAFTGMIRCGECGLLVTAEEKINRYGSRYTYYHCTKRRFDYRCRQPSIRLEELEDQIQRFIGTISIPPKLHAWALDRLPQDNEGRRMADQQHKQSVQKALATTKRALSNLTSLRVRELISEDEFVNDRRALEQDRLRLMQQAERAEQADIAFEPGKVLVSFSRRAADWFDQGDCETKRLILECLGSNLVLTAKRLNIQAMKPFCTTSKIETIPQLRRVVEDIRTLYAAKDPHLLRVLQNIRKLEDAAAQPSCQPGHAETCPMRNN